MRQDRMWMSVKLPLEAIGRAKAGADYLDLQRDTFGENEVENYTKKLPYPFVLLIICWAANLAPG